MGNPKMPIEKKKCMTPEFRVSHPHVFEKHSGFENQKPQYSIAMLFSKNTNITAMETAATNAAIEAWGDDEIEWPEGYKWPFRDGDKEPKKRGKPEYKNVTFVNATSKKTRPQVVSNKRDPETKRFPEFTKENGGEDAFYAGCYARAELLAYAYDTAGNIGIAFSLQNIQKIRDGASLSGRKTADEVFDDVDDGSDDHSSYNNEAETDETDSMGF
jgi:hypothetical protein